MKYELKIRKVDLRDGMLALCHLRIEYDERIVETSSLGV